VNEEKPAEPTVDGMPFDDGLGPTAQASEGVPIERPRLHVQQLHGDDDPSWQAPREKGISTDVGVALLIVAGMVVLVVLRIVGMI
jgi:hypothetical protein